MDSSTVKAWPEYLLPHMPTAKEVLAKGDVYDLAGYQWTDDEMATLLVECAGLLQKEIDDSDYERGVTDVSDDWLTRCDNLLSFSLTHSTVDLAVFATRIMLTEYQFPLHPGKMAHFNEFHRRCGQKVIDTVENPTHDHGDRTYWEDMADTLADILDRNPRITPPLVKMTEKKRTSAAIVEQREQQLAEKMRVREQRSRGHGYGSQEGLKIPGQECTVALKTIEPLSDIEQCGSLSEAGEIEKLKELDNMPYWN